MFAIIVLTTTRGKLTNFIPGDMAIKSACVSGVVYLIYYVTIILTANCKRGDL